MFLISSLDNPLAWKPVFLNIFSIPFGINGGHSTGTLWLLLPQLKEILLVENYPSSPDILKKLPLELIYFLRTSPGLKVLTVFPPFP